ncbi:MAG TPA: BatA domain-containing protein [Burkholderiales bacterium]|nr:BatA domain-containing protein [Burkholderiales bacterium]
MSAAAASMAAWLPFAGMLAAAAVVAFLYWLKPPPRRIVVASNLIWERVLRQDRRTSDSLRRWLSFLLAALIAVGLAGAIASAGRSQFAAGEGRVTIVIDDSPTMATRTTDGATRLDHALGKAREMMQARAAATEFRIADTMGRIAVPGFRGRDEALEQLAALRAQAGRLAAFPVSDGDEIVVFTDGVSIGTLPPRARVESVFEPVENTGITVFDVRQVPAHPGRVVAYVELANAGGVDKTIELTITGLGGKHVTRLVKVARSGTRGETVDVSGFDDGLLRASIAVAGDGFALDDVAYALLPARRPIRVALVTRGNAFLENALIAVPRVKLSKVAPERNLDDANYDVVVFDRAAPKARPRVPALLFRPNPVAWLPPQRKETAKVGAKTWDGAHPLLDRVSMRDLNVDRAAEFDLRDRAGKRESVIASAPDGQALIVASDEGPHWIAFSFALDESNFGLHAAFPMFLDNAINWMSGEPPAIARGMGAIRVSVGGARVLGPDGAEVAVRSIGGASLFDAPAPGLYTAISARERVRVIANLLDRRVTDVNASRLAAFKPGTVMPDDPGKSVPFDWIAASLLAGALLLLFEWWSWNRRLTV